MRQSEYLWPQAIGASAISAAATGKKRPFRVVIVSVANFAWQANYPLASARTQ
jgi:hypothetical protein